MTPQADRESTTLSFNAPKLGSNGLAVVENAHKEGISQPRNTYVNGHERSSDQGVQIDSLVIKKGVEAWKKITEGSEITTSKIPSLSSNPDWQSSHNSAVVEPRGPATPPNGHPPIEMRASSKMGCPFAAMQAAQSVDQQSMKTNVQRPESLPTPPETKGQFIDDGMHSQPLVEHGSPPSSVVGSVSKCPIRMLDERSPEEIAEYVEVHKHEIPRSHEICVKRYQSNVQSIRQLDAKYGSLVNMIQGLGMKHQPMLPTKDGEDDKQEEPHETEMDAKSIRKVEKWANSVKDTPEDAEIHSAGQHDDSQSREGHFERPLKEIRVGESPSRPWGISVPLAERPVHSERGYSQRVSAIAEQPKISERTTPSTHQPNVFVDKGTTSQRKEQPHMIFTGPVFIGYSPEQAAAVIQQCGLGTQQGQKP